MVAQGVEMAEDWGFWSDWASFGAAEEVVTLGPRRHDPPPKVTVAHPHLDHQAHIPVATPASSIGVWKVFDDAKLTESREDSPLVMADSAGLQLG